MTLASEGTGSAKTEYLTNFIEGGQRLRSTIPARPSDNIFAESQSGPRSSRRHLAMMSFFTFTEFDWLTLKSDVRNMVRVVHAFKPARSPQGTTDQDLDALPESFRFPHNLYQERERNRGHIKFGKRKIVEISSGIISSSSAFILLIDTSWSHNSTDLYFCNVFFYHLF